MKVRAALGILVCMGKMANACELPALPAIPAEFGPELSEIIVSTERYLTDIRNYTLCVREELENVGGDTAPETLRTTLVRRNNEALAEVDTVMALFNARVGSNELLRLAAYLTAPSIDCVNARNLDKSIVLNERSILFVMRDSFYLNLLATQCTGFKRTSAFMYRTDRVCSGQSITPVMAGTPAGVPCRLGDFFPLTKTQADLAVQLTAPDTPSPSSD